MDASATIYVVDDDQALRHSIRWLLEGAGFEVRCFSRAQVLLDEFGASGEPASGCALVDLRMPGMSGLELLEHLRARGVDLPVIMITGHGDVPAAVQAMKAGAMEFIEKPFDEKYLLGQVSEALRADDDQRRAAADRLALQRRYALLSPRERQVMELVAAGWLNKQIATELGLSHKTVEVHRAHVMEKMQARSLAALVRMAVALEQDQAFASLDHPTS